MRACAMFALPPRSCAFKNILEIWGEPPSVEDVFTQIQNYEDKLLASRLMPRYSVGWCHAHHRWCPFANSECRVQGPPCVDWSLAGRRLGLEGPFLPTLLASGSKADLVDAAVSVVENVPALKKEIVEQVYGPKFSVAEALQSPSDVGFEFISRRRTHCSSNAATALCIVDVGCCLQEILRCLQPAEMLQLVCPGQLAARGSTKVGEGPAVERKRGAVCW